MPDLVLSTECQIFRAGRHETCLVLLARVFAIFVASEKMKGLSGVVNANESPTGVVSSSTSEKESNAKPKRGRKKA